MKIQWKNIKPIRVQLIHEIRLECEENRKEKCISASRAKSIYGIITLSEKPKDRKVNIRERIGGIRFLNGRERALQNNEVAGTDHSSNLKAWKPICAEVRDPIYFNLNDGDVFLESAATNKKVWINGAHVGVSSLRSYSPCALAQPSFDFCEVPDHE